MERKLDKIFPFVSDEDLFGEGRRSDLYKVLIISNFDHWLSEDEALHLNISYATYVNTGDVPETYFEAEKKHLNLFRDIFHNVPTVYNFIENENGRGGFCQFESLEDFIEVCKNSLREKSFVRLCIPEWKLIISGGYDLTNIVHYTTDSVIEVLLELIEKNYLHAL